MLYMPRHRGTPSLARFLIQKTPLLRDGGSGGHGRVYDCDVASSPVPAQERNRGLVGKQRTCGGFRFTNPVSESTSDAPRNKVRRGNEPRTRCFHINGRGAELNI